MKTLLLLLSGIIVCNYTSTAQTDFTSWYRYGKEDIYYFQKDMYVFRCINGQEYADSLSLDTTIVDKLEYRGYTRDKLHIVYFDSTSTIKQKKTVKDKIKQYTEYEREFEVVTKDTTATYHQSQYLILEDMIELTLNSDTVPLYRMDSFKVTYGLSLFQGPANGTIGTGYIYTYKILTPLVYSSDIARNMWLNESDVISAIEPFIVNLFSPINIKDNIKDNYNIMMHPNPSDGNFELQITIYE